MRGRVRVGCSVLWIGLGSASPNHGAVHWHSPIDRGDVSKLDLGEPGFAVKHLQGWDHPPNMAAARRPHMECHAARQHESFAEGPGKSGVGTAGEIRDRGSTRTLIMRQVMEIPSLCLPFPLHSFPS